MIAVSVRYHRNSVSQILVTGHSEYEDSGKDIVCSAVSTAMYVSLGLIEKACPDYDFQADEKTPVMKLEIRKTNEFTDMITENLVKSLQAISEDYGQYVKIKFEK